MTDELSKPIDEMPMDGGVDSDGAKASDAAADTVGSEAVAQPEAVVDENAIEGLLDLDSTGEPIEMEREEDDDADEPQPSQAGQREPAEGILVEEPEESGEGPESGVKEWYILKVQSNREDSIREGLARRVAMAGLDEYFGEIIVPTEKVTEFRGGKKRIMKRKLYPGYLVVQMEINDDTWFLVRETAGIGDFTGAAGRPTPMAPNEVARIVARQEEKQDAAPKLEIGFQVGDRVKINEGTFENFEGEMHAIDVTNGRVTVMINIFGRSTPVELEYWQIEAV